jgi:hypothetical protein
MSNFLLEGPGGIPQVKLGGRLATNLPVVFGGTFTQNSASTIKSASATALAVGANGTTNPQFVVDDSTSSVATGLKVKGAAAAAGVALSTVSSGSAENLTIDAKGTGTITLNGTATGTVNIGTTSASLLVNSAIVSVGEFVTDNQNQVAAASYAVSHTIFVNDNSGVTYKVTNVSVNFGTTSSSGTLQVEVATGTQAVGAGTNQLTGTMSLSGTANTVVNGTVSGTPTTIASGARINLIFAGTVTGLLNCSVIVTLQRLS